MVTATLRMYAVGFGDCFLLSVPRAEDRSWRMLVDCGVHFRGPGEHSMPAIVDDLIAECSSPGDDPVIDLVVASHRHQDHVSGFANPRWSEVTVGEVWLPWCENPRDVVAQRLRTRLDSTARSLQLRFGVDRPEIAALALNSLSNERAMATLRTGFAGQARRRYLSAQEPTLRELDGLPGARVHLLGPPRSEAAIRAMEPPGLERWLALDRPEAESGRPEAPFGPAYAIGDRAAFWQRYEHLRVEDKLLDTVLVGTDDGLAAASWLDRALNNTSIVFVLEVDDVRMLFAGDAQWGVWREILDNTEARALLARTTLYKVSHHGSHNGSPKTLVNDVLPDSLTSMMSFRTMSGWKAIPKTELVASLGAEGRTLVRPDVEPAATATIRRASDGLWTEIDL